MSDFLDGLSDHQRAAAEALDGPVLIKAGPGAGKTRTITHRIAHGVRTGRYEESRTLAVTFTSRAAGELHARLAALRAPHVAVRTFHSAALRQLRHFWPDVVGGAPPRIEADRAPLLRQAAAGSADTPEALAAILTELDWAKAHGVTAAHYPAAAQARPTPLPADRIGEILERYEVVKTERGVMDFDDVLLVTIGLLETRSDVREAVRRAYRWITVDEYQDVSPLQQRILDLWVGDRGQVCVVGDPAQTIYQFAGADPGLLAAFPARHPGATVVELPETYRCPSAVSQAANRLARAIPGALVLRSVGDDPGVVRVLQFPGEQAECAGIADEIAGLLESGHAPDEVAVLYRAHSQGRPLQDHLRRRGIPYSTRGSERFFERAEVKEASIRYRGELRTDPGRPAADVMAAALSAMAFEPTPPDAPQARLRWESLAALSRMFPADMPGPDGLTELERRAADGEPPRPAGVALLTIHAAKGLEWDSVYVMGVTEGQLPLIRGSADDVDDEERRLMYVAVTRARHRLVVTWADTRPASRYLAAFDSGDMVGALPAAQAVAAAAVEHFAERGGPPAPCRWCGRALVTGRERVLGRCDTCTPPVDDALLERLTRWRDSVAADAGVPGHVVMTDVTLHAIAEQCPTTSDGLGAIPGLRSERLQEHGQVLLDLVRQSAPDPRP